MNKRILSLVLALVMVLGAFSTVFAAETKAEVKEVPKLTSSDSKVTWLKDNGIIEGRKVNADEKNNDLALDKNILRSEVTKLLVYAIGKQELAQKIANVVSPFKDVEKGHWANGYIAVGTIEASPKNGQPFLNGYPDKTFKPEWKVNYAELAKMLVVLVKENLTPAMIKEANNNWPSTWLAWAAQEGIFEGVDYVNSTDNAVRKDAFAMIYNALYRMKEWRLYPANETVGVISDYKVGDYIKLNGEDKEFKVADATTFVGSGLAKTAGERKLTNDYDAIPLRAITNWFRSEYFIGSLVRVITNGEGVVTHIVQLGNPINLAMSTDGWYGYIQDARNVASGKAIFSKDIGAGFNLEEMTVQEFAKGVYGVDYAGLTTKEKELYNERFAKIANNRTIGKVNVNSGTEFFIADYYLGSVKKVKNLYEAYSYLKWMEDTAYNVYVGYNENSINKDKVAKAVVFNKVEKGGAGAKVVRVVNQEAYNNRFLAQLPGATPTEATLYDILKGVAYPGTTALFDKLNVIEYGSNYAKLLINHKVDPIYEVKAVNEYKVLGLPYQNPYKLETIKLWDGKGYQTFYVAEDVDAFFYNEIQVGARVQIKEDKGAISVISVVPANAPLRGELPQGIKDGTIEAKVQKIISDNLADPHTVEALVSVDGSKYDVAVVVKLGDGDVFEKGNYVTLERQYLNTGLIYKEGRLLPVYTLKVNKTNAVSQTKDAVGNETSFTLTGDEAVDRKAIQKDLDSKAVAPATVKIVEMTADPGNSAPNFKYTVKVEITADLAKDTKTVDYSTN